MDTETPAMGSEKMSAKPSSLTAEDCLSPFLRRRQEKTAQATKEVNLFVTYIV